MAVRNESVRLSLQDDFTTGMAKAAASAMLLRKELDALSGASVTSARSRALDRTDKEIEKVGGSSKRTSSEIDRLSGRVKVLSQAAAALGPGLIPVGAVGIPAVSGLAAQLGFVVTAGAAVIGSFQGIGDALEDVNTARLEPTTENLEAARVALDRLSPAAAELVAELADLRPMLLDLRDIGAENLMPGVVESIDSLLTRLPEVQLIVANLNREVGTILADGADSVASGRWDEFFTFIATDAPPALASFARSVGNVTHAAAEMWMAFDPLNDDFARWLEDSTASLDRWATGLADTRGFQEFVAYVRETGPQVAETLGQVALAMVRILEAGAPLGGPILAGIEGIARAISAIADSDLGTPILAAIAALSALSRAQAVFGRASEISWVKSARAAETTAGKWAAAAQPLRRGAGLLAGLGVAATGAADGIGLTNTASGVLMGSVAGPWGAAIGGATGAILDFAGSQQAAAADIADLSATLDQQTGAITANTRQKVANRLENDGVLKSAEQLGVNLADVTDAALGNAEAMARVNDVLSQYEGTVARSTGGRGAGAVARVPDEMAAAADRVGDALSNQSAQTEKAVESAKRMGDATATTTGQFDTNTRSIRENIAAMRARTDAAREAFDAETGWRRALVEAREAAKDNNAGIDGSTEAALRNRDALSGLADAWATQEPAVRNNIARYKQARAQFIETAEGMGVARDRAKQLADRMLDIPKSVATRIDVETDPALRGIASLENRLRAIRDEDVFVNIRHRNFGNNSGFGPQDAFAAGGPVTLSRPAAMPAALAQPEDQTAAQERAA